uniref:Uncharacterized protein n=1 Tax=Picea glauca TaxID=3330 RepID=A0A117NIW9_PICGL|nr:hypothetical protein ABT39_MTgene429 [Picea glauca]
MGLDDHTYPLILIGEHKEVEFLIVPFLGNLTCIPLAIAARPTTQPITILYCIYLCNLSIGIWNIESQQQGPGIGTGNFSGSPPWYRGTTHYDPL